MPTCAVLTRLPTKPEKLEACAQDLAEVHSGLMAGEPDWVSTDILIDREDEAVLLLTHWRRDGACETFEAKQGYGAILKRLHDHLTGKPRSRTLTVVRERKRGRASETDIAISGSLGS